MRDGEPRSLDGVLLVAMALVAGGMAASAPRALGLAALAIAALLARSRAASRAALLMATLAMLVQSVRAGATLRAAGAAHDATLEVLTPPARCEGTATVVASPVVQRAGRGGEAAGASARVDVDLGPGRCGERAFAGPLRVRLHGATEDLRRGDRLEVLADLAPVHLFENEGQTDPRAGMARSGVTASGGIVDARRVGRGGGVGAIIDGWRARVRARIEATYHPEAQALGRALVMGETDLEAGDASAFRDSGLSHLLAVSGTHLVLAVLGLCAALRAVLVRIEALAARWDVGRIVAAVAIPAAWLYADFAGGGGSAMRAAIMLSAAMAARVLGRQPSGPRAFAVSLAAGAIADPLVASDLSFALSAAATAGLLALGPVWSAWLGAGPAPLRALGKAAGTTLAAMCGCAPVIAVVSPGMPVLGVAANIVAAPIGEVAALPVCLAHALLGWAPSVERGAAIIGSGALLAVRAIARLTAGAPGAQLDVPAPTAMQLAVLAVGAFTLWLGGNRRDRVLRGLAAAAALCLLELAAVRQGAPRDVLRVTAADVGQGDALLVDLPDGSLLVLDAGGFVGSPVDPGKRVLLPLLRARRRTRIDAAVISHPHPDHFGGMPSTLAALPLGELWDTGQGEAEGAGPVHAGLLAAVRARGVAVRTPASLCGAPRHFGGATLEVLAPCPGFAPDVGANDNSFVLRITYGRRAVLLVGDSEHHAEDALLARGAPLRADLLKVGHHGSRTSTTPAFLAAVAPELAVVSCGVRNRFGHPHPETLRTLASAGVPLLRTDRGGAVVWETDGEVVRVSRGIPGG
ncbi:MAG: DNA internalization-related competence protein ComEC/Rec2 [Polyangiaceae bacterium]